MPISSFTRKVSQQWRQEQGVDLDTGSNVSLFTRNVSSSFRNKRSDVSLDSLEEDRRIIKPQEIEIPEIKKESLLDKIKSKVSNLFKKSEEELPSPTETSLEFNRMSIDINPVKPGFLDRANTFLENSGLGLSEEAKKVSGVSLEESVKDPQLLTLSQRSFRAGIGDVIATAGATANWLGQEGIGTKLSQKGARYQTIASGDPVKSIEEFEWKDLFDPSFYPTTMARQLPFALALIPAAVLGMYAGTSTAVAVGLGTLGKFILGAIGAGALNRTIESALEAGSVYDEQLGKGNSREEADIAADKTFKGNMNLASLDALEFALAFAPAPKAAKPWVRALLRTAGVSGNILMGGGEEVIQRSISQKAQGEDFDITSPGTKGEFAIGAVMGAGLNVSGGIINSVKANVAQSFETEYQKEFDNNIDEGPEIAEIKALDTIAEKHPEEVSEIVETTIKNITGVEDSAVIAETSALDVESLGEDTTVYRGAKDQTIDVNREQGLTDGVSFSQDIEVAERFAKRSGGTVEAFEISSDAKVINHSVLEKMSREEVISFIKENEIDVVRFDIPEGAQGESELRVLNDSVLKTKDVLGDEQAAAEAEIKAEISKEKRADINVNDVALLKRIYGRSKKFQAGDIETIRAGSKKVRDLVNRVVENVQEANPDMSEAEAFDFALKLPTKKDEKAQKVLERVLVEDVVEKDPVLKPNIKDNLETLKKANEAIDNIPPSETSITLEKDWSGEFVLPETSKWERFRQVFEDSNLRLKTLNNSIIEMAGDTFSEHLDLYAQKDMLPRIQSDLIKRVREFKRDYVEGLVADEIAVEEVDDYLLALHAKEYNDEMNKRRRSKKQDPIEGLAGMTNEEAAKILAVDNSRLEKHVKKLKKYIQESVSYLRKNEYYSAEEIKDITSLYKNYVPLYRDMDGNNTGIGMKRGAGAQRSLIKRAKGSTRRVVSPSANVFYQREMFIMEVLKNDVGKTIIELTKEYSFLEDIFVVEKNPVAVLAKTEVTAEIDHDFISGLTDFAKNLGLDVVETKGLSGKKLGYYSPSENKVVRRFASSRETFAHEIGHFLDDVFKLGSRVINKKLFKVSKEMLAHSEKEVGETQTRLADPRERFANAFSWWLVHRDLAAESMPNFNAEITKIISEDSKLKGLLDIKPSPKPKIESLLEEVWGQKFKIGDNIIYTRIDGDKYFITVSDERLSKAIKDLSIVRMPSYMRFARNALSIWSGFKTRWRPEFLITNFQRDTGEAFVNLNIEAAELGKIGKGLQKDTMKGIFPAQKEVWGYLRGGKNATVDKFFKDGGDVGHFWLEPVKSAEETLLDLQKEIQNVGIEKIKNPIRKAGDVIDNIQTMVELGVRYSAYKQLISRGMSSNKAIQAVADLTINFSRQGEISPVLKSLYGFINPTIQGTSKVARTITSRKGRARVAKALSGLILLGFFTRTFSKMIDPEGDEQMSEWTKNHKLAFSIGNGKEVTLWNMPYGYTVFYSMGNQLAEVLWGTKDIDDALVSVLEVGANSFAPFGTRVNDWIPTLARPISDINANNAWYDGKIHPEQQFTKTPKPNSATHFKNTGEVAIFITSMLNNLTGGNEGKSGFIDLRPDDLEYMYDQWFGGPFEFVTSSLEAAARGIGGEFDPNKTPFVRQFFREGRAQQWSYSVIYDTLEKSYKKDLSDIEKDRFYRAVDTGVEEKIFDQDRADGYIRDFIRALYKISGPVTDDINIESLSKASDEEVEKLVNTYSSATRRKVKIKIKKLKEKSK